MKTLTSPLPLYITVGGNGMSALVLRATKELEVVDCSHELAILPSCDLFSRHEQTTLSESLYY